ncbi:Tar ligand binding domain-containing protein [Shigella flexneri]
MLCRQSTALNEAGTSASGSPPDDIKALMVVARSSLKQADAQFKAFTAQEAVSEKQKALNVAMKKKL